MLRTLSSLGKMCVVLPLILLVQSISAAQAVAEKKLTAADSVLPMLMGLLGILAIIFILAAVLKRFSGFNLVANHIKVIESQNLGAKEKLIIVEVQGKQYLLGVTPHTINRIDSLQEPVQSKKSHPTFESMMKQFLRPAKNQTQASKSDSADQASGLTRDLP